MSAPAPVVLQVGERFEHYDVGNDADAGVWEVIRVSPCSAVCRKVGRVHKRIEVSHEWVTDERSGRKVKRPLLEPKIIEGDFPESRTITISPRAIVRRVEGGNDGAQG